MAPLAKATCVTWVAHEGGHYWDLTEGLTPTDSADSSAAEGYYDVVALGSGDPFRTDKYE